MYFCQSAIVKTLRVLEHVTSGTRVYSVETYYIASLRGSHHCVAGGLRPPAAGGQTDKRTEKHRRKQSSTQGFWTDLNGLFFDSRLHEISVNIVWQLLEPYLERIEPNWAYSSVLVDIHISLKFIECSYEPHWQVCSMVYYTFAFSSFPFSTIFQSYLGIFWRIGSSYILSNIWNIHRM